MSGPPLFLSAGEKTRWEEAGSPLPGSFDGAAQASDYAGSTIRESRRGLIGELWEILDRPNGTPALRAAVFGALAEEPGIELNRDAEDLVGRHGYALTYPSAGGAKSDFLIPGLGVEYIFDPDTSEVLGKREFVADPAALDWRRDWPAGTTIRASADLRSGIVGSTEERP